MFIVNEIKEEMTVYNGLGNERPSLAAYSKTLPSRNYLLLSTNIFNAEFMKIQEMEIRYLRNCSTKIRYTFRFINTCCLRFEQRL